MGRRLEKARMKINFTLTGKMMAAGAVLLVGLVLALASTAAHGTDAGPANTAALARSIVDETDHVTAVELAQWLIEKRSDFQLIDIRLPWQFDDYHIPTAVNIPLTALFEEQGLSQLSRTKKVVVYGLGAGHAAEAQLLLSMKGYKALSVKEGISAWWNDVITPVSLRSESTSPAGYRQAKQLREQFLGAPGAAAPAAAPAANPADTAPSTTPPSSAPTGGKKLKLGRGCS
jgi:rhodanese-related sulfurtransferase